MNVRIDPNNKSWVKKGLEHHLNQRKIAFLEEDLQKVRKLEKEIRCMVKKEKMDYKNKVEDKLKNGNARDAWRGLNTLMGSKHKAASQCDGPVSLSSFVPQAWQSSPSHLY